MIQQTSLEAYKSIDNLSGKRKMVYDTIKKLGTACNQQIAKALGWDINRVTPRTNELVYRDLVEEARKDIYPETGKRVIYWRIRTS